MSKSGKPDLDAASRSMAGTPKSPLRPSLETRRFAALLRMWTRVERYAASISFFAAFVTGGFDRRSTPSSTAP
jgi:hypothetical protein